MENTKQIFSDQYNIPWNILDKRNIMITSYSNYFMRLTQHKVKDMESRNIIVSCMIYLFNELKSLKNTKIKQIKSDDLENLIDYKTALELYHKHISEKLYWNDEDLLKMYVFVLEACRVSGIADPGYSKIDYTKTNAVRGLHNGQVFE